MVTFINDIIEIDFEKSIQNNNKLPKPSGIEGGRRQPGASGPYKNLCMGQSPRAKHLAVVFST